MKAILSPKSPKRPKIAVLGTASATLPDAPFDDPEWTIWGIGLNPETTIRRWDAWWEIHNTEEFTRDYGPHVKWLIEQRGPIYVKQDEHKFKNPVIFPMDRIQKEFPAEVEAGFLSSSTAFMLAWAIMQNPTDIGIWGVDMFSSGEYEDQRAGCQHFLIKAEDRGIKLHIPDKCDILKGGRIYSYDKETPMEASLKRKLEIFTNQRGMLQQQQMEINNKVAVLNGSIETMNYVIRTWSGRHSRKEE